MKNHRSTAAAIRSVRLAGGMVLMAYVTGHLTNIAFGLVSLDLLDQLRIPLMAPWQSIPGQILLYGALASHLGLGLLAVAQRRSFASLNRSDATQLALGLLIPVFLAWHVLRTRGAIVLGGKHATYAVLMISYWQMTPFFGLLQVLGLVAAWVHGCLGLYGWLRLRRWWPVIAPFLYPIAFALPILALLGFVEAGKQALDRFSDAGGDWSLYVRAALAKFAVLAPRLQVWRDHFVLGYATTAIAACLVFAGQAIRHRRRTARNPCRRSTDCRQPGVVSAGDRPATGRTSRQPLLRAWPLRDLPSACPRRHGTSVVARCGGDRYAPSVASWRIQYPARLPSDLARAAGQHSAAGAGERRGRGGARPEQR